MTLIRSNPKHILPLYLFNCLRSKQAKIFFETNANTTTNISNLSFTDLERFSVPLPPLEVQERIVAEIEGYQKVRDAARQIVESYKPTIKINPAWPMVKLGEVCKIQRGKFSHRPRNEPKFFNGKYPFIQTGDVVKANGGIVGYTQTLNETGLAVSKLFKPTIVLITIAANIGDTAILNYDACFTDSVVGLIPYETVDPFYLELVVRTQKKYLNNIAPQAAQKNINNEILRVVEIPLPPLEIQQKIVAEIKAEQEIVNANKKLITIFEHKIQAAIADVWGK